MLNLHELTDDQLNQLARHGNTPEVQQAAQAELDARRPKWKLAIGCHRNTITSRDSTVETHDSLDACKKAVAETEAFYRSIGYFVWFAEATSPDGEKHELHPGTPCRY